MLDLIKRNTPSIADCFIVTLADKGIGQYYEISGNEGKIEILADCAISAAMGYYDYLKTYCGLNLAHCGNTDVSIGEAVIPKEKTFKKILQEKRAYLNYCTFGYSMRSWGWDKWEKEIDLMAMRGVNMPLTVVGYEAVIFYTLMDFGFSEDEALSFIAGPSFYPWQMMTNLDSFMHIPDKKYIDKRLELGKKIIERELSLGMTPIQQGFAGHIPKELNDKFKAKSRLLQLPTWCGFKGTVQLDPLDDNFTLFGTALLNKQKELFGAYHYYACDPFHENEPPVDSDKYLNDVGKTISKMYQDFDKDSIWVMQSWSLREEIVKAVEKDRLLILDLDGYKYAQNEGFWGYDFILGTLHNFGDRNSLHGSIDALAENPYLSVKKEYPACKGTGIFMEGFFQNPLYYDLAFDVLTSDEKICLDSWLKDYAFRRYGSDESCLIQAVNDLYESCYNKNCTGRETSSIVAARPSTTHYHTAPNDVVALRYDNKKLFSAVNHLLQSERAYKDGYKFDVCDILRQYISNLAKEVYFDIMTAFNKKDRDGFNKKTAQFKSLLTSLDTLLATRSELSFISHIDEAKANACCKEHEELFRKNEVMLLTIWGPFENNELFDYAWREWSGLIKDYYLVRWEMFFDALLENFENDGSTISDTPFNHNERNDYETTPFQQKLRDFEFSFIDNYNPSEYCSLETIETAKKIIEKLS